MAHVSIALEELLDRMEARWDGARFWTQEEGRLVLNQALKWWNLYTGTWRKTVVLPTVASSPWVSLGADTLLYRTAVRWRDRPALRRASIPSLDLAHPSWVGQTIASGAPVPTEPSAWAPNGLTEFAIWPADTAVSQLIVEGVADTPTLAGVGDFVDISESELAPILGEALHLSAFKLGGPRFAATAPLHQAFLVAALAKNDHLGASIPFRRAAGLDTGLHERRRRQFPPAASKLQAALGGGEQT